MIGYMKCTPHTYFKIVFSLQRDIFHGFLPINTFPECLGSFIKYHLTYN